MKTSMRKKVILVLLIAFICRFAQDLFNPYISLDSYTNWTLWSLVILDSVMLTIGLIIGGMFFSNLKKQWKKNIIIVTIILFTGALVYVFVQKSAFLRESALSIITIIVSAAWKTGMFVIGIVIIIGIACFVQEKVRNGKN